MGGLHNLHGIKAPAFIPAKARHMIKDCKLIAERNNVKFKFNSYFPIRSLNLMRGVLVAEEDNVKNYYIDNIFNTIWQDGLNMNDEIIIQKVIKNLNINPNKLLLLISNNLFAFMIYFSLFLHIVFFYVFLLVFFCTIFFES